MGQTIHLFAGAGGGILADLILGHNPRVAVEINPERAQLLRLRYPGLEVITNDIRRVDFTQWHGKVDYLHAGIPCPLWSSARRGMGQPEDLSREVIRATRESQPKFIFLECVPKFRDRWPEFYWKFLDEGYTLSRPLILGASDVGAPHSRKRCWIAGYSHQEGQSIMPFHAEMARLPKIDSSGWEIEPSSLQVDDGVADKWEMECAGDGQVPLCAAVAWKILGGPLAPEDR